MKIMLVFVNTAITLLFLSDFEKPKTIVFSLKLPTFSYGCKTNF